MPACTIWHFQNQPFEIIQARQPEENLPELAHASRRRRFRLLHRPASRAIPSHRPETVIQKF